MATILTVENLKTYFFTDEGIVKAVDGLSFDVQEGEALGIVGESGCGKSVCALSIMRLLSHPAKIVGGRITFKGKSILDLTENDMRHIRGNEISMIFQEPMTSLNPVFTVGYQIAEAVILHQKKTKKEALEIAVKMLEMVAIPDPEKRINDYPHQLSGGMRQRVMIAMALACKPSLLIADEPTTALDVTIQAQFLDILRRLRAELGLSVILITHDLGVVAEFCDRVIVMYTGKIVEEAPVSKLFEKPLHPYTKGLLDSIPGFGEKKKRLNTIKGQVPNPINLPAGCHFCDRCPDAMNNCKEKMPALSQLPDDVRVRCFLYHGICDEK